MGSDETVLLFFIEGLFFRVFVFRSYSEYCIYLYFTVGVGE